MKHSNKLIAGAVAVLLPAAFAMAQNTPPEPEPGATRAVDLSPLDADKDGRISKSEAAAEPAIAQIFAQVDANSDGYIDSTESKRLRTPAEPGQ
jgi:hypothetical protein